MDGAILGVLIANTGLLVWIGYRLGSLTKTVSFLEKDLGNLAKTVSFLEEDLGNLAKTVNFLNRNCPLLKDN